MNYQDFLNYHNQYGTTQNDILARSGYQDIIENVVIAPWWDVSIFAKNSQIKRIKDGIYLVSGEDYQFNFIELKAVGAPVIIDAVMHLGLSKCKKIIFIGSAGALNKELSIGDIVVPNYSICGEGASRYLNRHLEDDFGNKYKPDDKLYESLLEITKQACEEQLLITIPNYTVDSIFLQFAHIDYIKSLGAQTIEMETSALFKAADVVGIKAAALFVISDNSFNQAGLYSGRNNDDKLKRTNAKQKIVPEIISEVFKTEANK